MLSVKSLSCWHWSLFFLISQIFIWGLVFFSWVLWIGLGTSFDFAKFAPSLHSTYTWLSVWTWMQKSARRTEKWDVRTNSGERSCGAGEAEGREEELPAVSKRFLQSSAQRCHTSQLGLPVACLRFLGWCIIASLQLLHWVHFLSFYYCRCSHNKIYWITEIGQVITFSSILLLH